MVVAYLFIMAFCFVSNAQGLLIWIRIADSAKILERKEGFLIVVLVLDSISQFWAINVFVA